MIFLAVVYTLGINYLVKTKHDNPIHVEGDKNNTDLQLQSAELPVMAANISSICAR